MATLTLQRLPTASKGLNVALWIVQATLAAVFLFTGSAKAFSSIAELARAMAWVSAVSPDVVRFVGWCELLGAAGLILPGVTRSRAVLTPFAAIGLASVMVLAGGLHLSRGEYFMLPFNLILGALAGFVAWGRLTRAPLVDKNAAAP